jgi:hypothetical protein
MRWSSKSSPHDAALWKINWGAGLEARVPWEELIMSWFDNLLPSATEFFEGVAEGLTIIGGRYDLRKHLLELAVFVPMYRVNVDGDVATFAIQFRGVNYRCGAVHHDGHVLLSVWSNIEFARGLVPRDLMRSVEELNSELPRCDFGLLNLDERSVWCAQCGIAASQLDEASLVSALGELAMCVSRLDAWLSDNGFAR